MGNSVEEQLLMAQGTCKNLLLPKNVTEAELKNLFELYSENKKGKFFLDSSNSIFDAINYTVENILGNFFYDGLKTKINFANMLVDDILNGRTTLKSVIETPCSFLPDNIKIDNETLNNLLKQKINEDLNNPDSIKFDLLDISDLQNILDALESVNYLEEKVKENIRSVISQALCGKISLELEQILERFKEDVAEAKEYGNFDFDAKSYKNEFIDKVTNLENHNVVRGTQTENFLQEKKKSFEEEFDKDLSELIDAIIEGKLSDELDNLNSEGEIDNYIESSKDTVYTNINTLLNEINKEETKTELEKKLNDRVKVARLICKSSKTHEVKTIIDDGVSYAIFDTERFPINNCQEKMEDLRMKMKHSMWKIVPQILPNGNVLITFQDPVSGKIIRPNDLKKLRGENSYEISIEERKKIEEQIKEVRKGRRLLQGKIRTEKDETAKEQLQEQLQKYTKEIPFFLRVCDLLNSCYKYVSDIHYGDIDYIKSKIPAFDPDAIKITPDIMENLREMAECSKTMLLGQKDALIIEGEAGVGKNVLIEIFAHFTNRPVFVFACGKKTDAHDLTYQWILDESGSKKLNSKIYEAIHTPGAILVLDEINTLDPGVIKMLNGLFDKRKTLVSPEAGGGDAKALPDVLLFGTMNPVGYSGTQKIPQDVDSRFRHIIHDYDRMFDKEGGVSYSDALRTYGNVNYFWKLASGNGMKKEDIEMYEEALLDKRMGNKLSKKKQEILGNFRPISDADFIFARNQLFIAKNERKVVDEFGLTFVEGMKDIYTIVLFSNYIRLRHKIKQFGIESKKLPRSSETDDLFEEKSFSPRLTIQALEQLNNGNEISSAKNAVIQTYIQQISNVKKRNKIASFLGMMTNEELEKQLKNEEVQKILLTQKPSEVDVL